MHLKQEYFNDKRRLPVTEKKRELTKEEKITIKKEKYLLGKYYFWILRLDKKSTRLWRPTYNLQY